MCVIYTFGVKSFTRLGPRVLHSRVCPWPYPQTLIRIGSKGLPGTKSLYYENPKITTVKSFTGLAPGLIPNSTFSETTDWSEKKFLPEKTDQQAEKKKQRVLLKGTKEMRKIEQKMMFCLSFKA